MSRSGRSGGGGSGGNLASRSLQYIPPSTPNFLKQLKAQVDSSSSSSSYSSRQVAEPQDELTSLFASTSSASKSQSEAGTSKHAYDSGEEDDLNEAQVVVLKDGKHLSKEQAEEARRLQRQQQDAEEDERAAGRADAMESSNRIGTVGSSSKRTRRDPVGVTSHNNDDEEAKGLGGDDPKAQFSKLLDQNTNTREVDRSKRSLPKSKASKGSYLEDVKEILRIDRETRKAAQDKKSKDITPEKQQNDAKRRKKNQEVQKQKEKEKQKTGKGLSFSFDE